MKRFLLTIALLACTLLLTQCGKKNAQFTFDGSKEMSGTKFALKDINPDLPTNWDDYNFVVLEYKISTAQRFQLGFTTDWGYNELRVMSYVPNAWNRLAIPLKYYTELPDPAHDLAATFNHARYTGWVNLGGKRGPMHGVDSIGVRIRRAIGKPTIEIRNVTLAVEDPGDLYMEETPAFDEFGQSMLVEWPGKAHSLADLEADWRAEEAEEVSTVAYNYSKYGGYKQKQLKGTGFFRTQKVDGRWWLVDPEGYLFLSVGVDCVNYGNGGNVRDYDKRPNMYKELPPEEVMPILSGRPANAQVRAGTPQRTPTPSLGMWNQYRRYGENFREKAREMVIKRMDKWGINTIANWSSQEIIGMNRKAFILSLGGLGMERDLMGLCDIWRPDYLQNLDRSIAATVQRNLDNPWLIGYFVANEPAWLNEEVRLCQLILDGPERPIQKALKAYLDKNDDTEQNRRAFIISSFDTFLHDVNRIFKKHDPNHLNMGIRFGDPDGLGEDVLKACATAFDVFSFNCYMEAPKFKMMDRAMEIMDLPMIIGEYHFGTVDHGLAQSLWQVEDQQQRGVAYRYYTENAYAHPALVGTGYFQWCDQEMSGRGDGENYNCGLVDVTDRPYAEQVAAMSETAKVLFDVHSGTKLPFSERARDTRGHGSVPDLWNK
ncbi:MAG: hypothetical protein GX125_02670 [Bacteroidales bacterium]|jgi:hypothetical protein|nr:hypothetical protein [Bacteroidota bacterium]NLN99158.1 hypothetical protein [Bacteroidales bacterium]